MASDLLEPVTCPMWPLIKVYHKGSWTDPYAETFGEDGVVPTHIHIYKFRLFLEACQSGNLVIPESVTTYSEETTTVTKEG